MSDSKDKCAYKECDRSPKMGMTLHNTNGGFPEMKLEEIMHIECYIRHCVHKAMEEVRNEYQDSNG